MTFMMTSSNYDKSDFVNFFIKTYSILSIQYMYKISCKMDKNFLRYTMFFHRGPTSWSYFWTSYVHSIYVMCPDTFRISSSYALFPGNTRMYQLLCPFWVNPKSRPKILSEPNDNLKITPLKRNNVTRYENVTNPLSNFWSCSKDSRCLSV